MKRLTSPPLSPSVQKKDLFGEEYMGETSCAVVIAGGTHEERRGIIKQLGVQLKRQGFAVMAVPCSSLHRKAHRDARALQRHALVNCISREDRAMERLRRHARPKRILLVEQGVMGGVAHTSAEAMFEIWRDFGCSRVELRDSRYAGVILLGGPADRLLAPAWTGCPHLAYVAAGLPFREKAAHALRWARHFVSGMEIERAWRTIEPVAPERLPVGARRISITQSYIRDPSAPKRERIRMRGENGEFVHFRSLKQRTGACSRSETEPVISAYEFAHLHHQYGCPLPAVRKDRWCFLENGMYWEFDIFLDIKLQKLELEMAQEDTDFSLPSCLAGNLEEVTGDPYYSNSAISERIARLQAQAA